MHVEAIIPEHVAAFRILFHIIGLLRTGAVDVMKHVESLRVLMADHVAAVVKLYGAETMSNPRDTICFT